MLQVYILCCLLIACLGCFGSTGFEDATWLTMAMHGS